MNEQGAFCLFDCHIILLKWVGSVSTVLKRKKNIFSSTLNSEQYCSTTRATKAKAIFFVRNALHIFVDDIEHVMSHAHIQDNKWV